MSQDLLNQIQSQAATGSVSLEQVIAAYNQGIKSPTQKPIEITLQRARFSLTNILSYIGGLVVAIGIAIVLGVNWQYYSDLVRLFLTLGLGLSFFTLANGIMLKFDRYSFLANICHLVAGLLIPAGVFQFLSMLPPSNIDMNLVIGNVFLGVGVLYLLADFVFKKGLSIFYVVTYFSISFWAYFGLILSNSNLQEKVYDYRLIQWGFLFTAIIYLLVALASWNWQRKWLAHLAMNIGVAFYYIGVFSLIYYIPGYEGYRESNGILTGASPASGSKILEFLYGIIFVPFYLLTVRINSRWLLLITTFGLIFWLLYLNNRYFFEGASFGVDLITSGLIMIGVSIGSIKLSQYLKKQQAKK